MLEPNLTIAFHGLDHSDAVEERVREEARKLDRIFDRIIGGTVRIEAPHRHQSHNRHYEVHIQISMPGKGEIVVSQEPGKSEDHEDLFKTIHQAFNAARRQLKERVEKMRGNVKNHGRQVKAAPAAGSESV